MLSSDMIDDTNTKYGFEWKNRQKNVENTLIAHLIHDATDDF